MTTAIGVMARAPAAGGKTRLASNLSAARLGALRYALLADTLRVLDRTPDVFVFFTPNDAEQEIVEAGAAAMMRVPQVGGDLGARMLAALRHLLEERDYDAALLVGTDVPLLAETHLAEAITALSATISAERSSGRRIVLGPADDGGYYLIGMTHVLPELFQEIPWGSGSVLVDTLRAAERIGVDARLIRRAYDIDTIEDARRLERDLEQMPGSACVNLRRWFADG